MKSNRWFFDTEFDENGVTIKLISIALVSEDGREYYAVCLDGWDLWSCDDWVKANVIPKLPAIGGPEWKPRAQIADEIRALVGDEPEFWAYFADYDWVVLCQLYGKMINLPPNFPKFCMDLKQLMKMRGIKRADLPGELAKDDPAYDHGALSDARWCRDTWLWLQK